MATNEDFSAEEWEAISDGPVYAGFMIITASKGGTIRETFSMSKAWAEARQRQGESELLDAIVAEKPKLDEKPGSAIELHKAGIQMLQQAVQVIEAKSPSEVDNVPELRHRARRARCRGPRGARREDQLGRALGARGDLRGTQVRGETVQGRIAHSRAYRCRRFGPTQPRR